MKNPTIQLRRNIEKNQAYLPWNAAEIAHKVKNCVRMSFERWKKPACNLPRGRFTNRNTTAFGD